MADDIPTIRGIEVRTVVAPMTRTLRTASGSIPGAPLVLIDVLIEEGATGRAYIFGYAREALAPIASFLESLAESLVGKPISPVERMREFEARFRLLGRQGLVGMALSGLDMALWDALGRASGRGVAELLGGGLAPIRAYDSYGVVDPIEDRRDLERSIDQGFRAIKVKIGMGGAGWDVENVAAIRDIIGPDVALMVDYNQSLDAAEAIRRIDRLARYDLHWVEEPVPAEDLPGHARVRAASPVPIQTGENWWFPSDMARALEAGACDYAMPDLMKIGGITGWLSVMGQGAAASIPLSSHIFIEASAHALAVTPTRHWLEYLDIAGAVLAEPLRVEDGCVAPRSPGLGIEWDEAAIARHAV